MAHFAITDAEGSRFRHFERTGRGALGLAGATARPFRVWLDDWSAEGVEASTLPIRLRATEDEASLDLVLDTARPIVLQGDRGLSRKSAAPGNASYYYSMTRLATRGSVRIEGVSIPVEGNSWLDREWGSSSLEKGQAGWDWFALQLSDGRDLMFYRLRRGDNVTDPFSAGTLVLPDGSVRPLSADDVRIETLGYWKSPESGARYPSRWRLLLPSERLELEVIPLIPDQELRTSVRYWEGAVGVRGTSRGKPVEGDGYVELTGYGETADVSVFGGR
jgi:predicted secreted hydrolase